jgi:hypothetical protein
MTQPEEPTKPQAYEQGRQARRDQRPSWDCPLTYPPHIRAAWGEGWRDSDAMIRALAPHQ